MSVDEIVVAIGARVPLGLAARLFGIAAGDLRVALCMHRIGVDDGPADGPHMTCRPETLDAIVAALLRTRPSTGTPWLTVCFDDGYLDAVEYVRSRAPRHPDVEWVVFACPEKAERQAGFRWDVPGAAPDAAKQPMDIDAENSRPELLAAGRSPRTRVATVAELRSLLALPNVVVGNHTNTHALQTGLSRAQAEREYERSVADFERLFGPQRQFAFPFGTPHHEITEEHVRLVWAHGTFDVWTTERRPYAAGERSRGAPVPRFSPDGRWSASSIVLWIAAHALRFRLQPGSASFAPALVRTSAVADGSATRYPTGAGTGAGRA